ncbi:MAG: alkaline phosphatase D family protein, partial [Actinomadura sp.]
NTSHAWRQEMRSAPWWRPRVVGGLGSYWIYQHLGNLTPAERASDRLYAAVRAAADGGPLLDDFAEAADRDPARSRWSYAHDLGGSRLIVLDSRCARLLTADRRAMLDDTELRWFDEQCAGDRDQLLIASSLPYLLPPAIHHAEAWNEAVAGGAWGRWWAGRGERLRRAADLEHWAAFDGSFRGVARDVLAVARGARGRPPAGITFLSGDIHYSYLARVTEPSTPGVITQVVCSPLRNPLAARFRWANIVACGRALGRVFRAPARLARVPRPPLRWRLTEGPWFQNAIATVEIDGRTATVRWETPSGPTTLTELARTELTTSELFRT